MQKILSNNFNSNNMLSMDQRSKSRMSEDVLLNGMRDNSIKNYESD
jgi:hypothetical protein